MKTNKKKSCIWFCMLWIEKCADLINLIWVFVWLQIICPLVMITNILKWGFPFACVIYYRFIDNNPSLVILIVSYCVIGIVWLVLFLLNVRGRKNKSENSFANRHVFYCYAFLVSQFLAVFTFFLYIFFRLLDNVEMKT